VHRDSHVLDASENTWIIQMSAVFSSLEK